MVSVVAGNAKAKVQQKYGHASFEGGSCWCVYEVYRLSIEDRLGAMNEEVMLHMPVPSRPSYSKQ